MMTFRNIRGDVLLNEPMSSHTSYKIGGPADALVVPADREDLLELLRQVRDQKLPFFVLGGGTNLLVRDKGFRGVVVNLRKLNNVTNIREYRSVGGTYTIVSAEAGAGLARLLNFCVENDLTGLEFASGIPGTVGGALCMNAGTAEGEIGDVTETVSLVTPAGDVSLLKSDEITFGYRATSIPRDHLIVEATFILRRGEAARIREHVKKLQDTRKERQPWGFPNAGSVFKNPLDDAAGKLIEQAGLKGVTKGRAQVSEKHANFIVNLGGATAADVLGLMEIIKERVLEVHKIRLEPEIKIIGEE